jgi:hypothetical protein
MPGLVMGSQEYDDKIDRTDTVACEICPDPIQVSDICFHYFDVDGEHLFHARCHDEFMQERETGILDVYIYDGSEHA